MKENFVLNNEIGAKGVPLAASEAARAVRTPGAASVRWFLFSARYSCGCNAGLHLFDEDIVARRISATARVKDINLDSGSAQQRIGQLSTVCGLV